MLLELMSPDKRRLVLMSG